MAESGLNIGGYIALFALVAGALFAYALARAWARGRVTVYDHEQAVLVREGVAERVVGPGRYATWPAPVEYVRLDMRSQSALVPGQEILTADSLTLRASINVVYRIGEPLAYRRTTQAPEQRLYEAAQTALRRVVGAEALDAILADRGVIERGLKQAVSAELGEIGLHIEAATLRDLTLSGPAKQALADLWKAEKEGQAALVRARGEQAALRSLANAARLLKGNPELMNLRILQTASGKPGAPAPTIVLGGGAGLLPVGQGGEAPAPDTE